MIFNALYPCVAKQLFIISSLVLVPWSNKPIVIWMKYEGPITFLLFFFKQKMNFSTPNVIWDILYIENLVVHLSYLHFQLYKNIWFLEIWQKCYEWHSFDCEMVQIYQYTVWTCNSLCSQYMAQSLKLNFGPTISNRLKILKLFQLLLFPSAEQSKIRILAKNLNMA